MLFEERAVAEIPAGSILAHSISLNGRRLSKGHRLTEEDIETLRQSPHDMATIALLAPQDVHEDEAADRLAKALAGQGVTLSKAFTGRSNIFAKADGLLCLDKALLSRINHTDEAVTVATLANFTRVAAKQMVATIKIIPFAVDSGTVVECESLAAAVNPAIRVAPFQPLRCGLIQTTLPTLKPSILSKTRDVLEQRIASLGGCLVEERHCAHSISEVASAIRGLRQQEPDLILITGASAVTDRRDVMPAGIAEAGGEIIHLGMPVDPGNLLLLGALDEVPVIGMPGCARSPKLNGFDWVLQRIFADLPVDRDAIMDMGIGGLLTEIQTRPHPRNEGQATGNTARPKVCGLVLAAGRSSRMGEQNKLLADVKGQAMVSHVVAALTKSQAGSVHVVTGHDHKAVENAVLSLSPSLVHNPDYMEGLSSSLKRGIAALPADCEAALVCLGDMPFITPAVIDHLIGAFNPTEGRDICVPAFNGRRGNPVLIGRRYFPEIHEISGDTGAKDLIQAYADAVCEVPIDDDAILTDIDTPENLVSVSSD